MAGQFALDDYITVSERIQMFYGKHPDGSIQTEIISNHDGQVVFKAYAYRNQEDKIPSVGHAMEKESSSFINKTSHIENCETSAIGRALAIMGFGISKSVASREEVENAKLQQQMLTEKITKESALVLKSLIEGKKGDINKTLAHYKVAKLEDLTTEQAADLKAKLFKE